MHYRDEVRRHLKSKPARIKQTEFLNEVKERHPVLQRFFNADDLLAFLRNRKADMEIKDAALLALVMEHQRGGSGSPFTLLAVVMFPKLDRLYNGHRHKLVEADYDDLWGNIVGAFVDALDRYPTERRQQRVAANISWETIGALYRGRKQEARLNEIREQYSNMATALYKDKLQPYNDALWDLSLGDLVKLGNEPRVPPDADEFSAAEHVLDPYIVAGVINRDEKFLILGVKVYGRTLRELASELGINREAAKYRYRRAFNRLQDAARKENEE